MAEKTPGKFEKTPNIKKILREQKLSLKETKDILAALQAHVKVLGAAAQETANVKLGFRDIGKEIEKANVKAIGQSDTIQKLTTDINKISLENLTSITQIAEQHENIGTGQFRQIVFQKKLYEIEKLRNRILDEVGDKNKKHLLESIKNLTIQQGLLEEQLKIQRKFHRQNLAIADSIVAPIKTLKSAIEKLPGGSILAQFLEIDDTDINEVRDKIGKRFREIRESMKSVKIEAEIKDDIPKKVAELIPKTAQDKMIDDAIERLDELETPFENATKGAEKIAGAAAGIVPPIDIAKDLIGGILGDMGGILGAAGGILQKFLGWAGVLLIIAKLIETAWKRFVEIDKITRSLRDTTGFTGDNLKTLKDQTVALNLEFQKYGVSLEDAAKISAGIVSILGSLGAVTKEDTKNVAIMTKLFGVSAAEAGKLYKVVLDMAGGNAEIASQTAATVKSLAKQTKVSPQAAFKDLAMNAEFVARFTKDGGENMIKAAFAARKYGMELSTLAKISENLLDFETSIRNQLEASFFIGRNLNLDRARYYAFTGDIKNLQGELLDQMGSVEEFNELDVISRQKLAGAIGITTAELLHYLAIQQRLNIVGDTSLSIYQKLDKGATLSDLLKLDEGVLTDLEKFQLSLKNLIVSIGSVLLPIIVSLSPILSVLGDIINGLATGFQILGQGIGVVVDIFKFFGEFLFPAVEGMKNAGETVEWLADVFKIAAMAISAAFILSNPFGWVVGIVGALGLLKKYWDDIIKVFTDAWDWVFGNSIWSADTIRTVFEGIVDVIKSVGTFILDAITWPFRTAWDFISGLFGGVKSIFGGEIASLPPIKIEAIEIKPSSESKKVIDAAIKIAVPELTAKTESDKAMVAMVQKLDVLIELMAQPAVIKMDGRKVGEQIARRIPRKGGV